MQDDANYNIELIQNALVAMSYTKKDFLPEFQENISKTNQNGIHHVIWAKRSDILEELFAKRKNIEVFHIKRSGLWQIDPVVDMVSGDLILLFARDNFRITLDKFLKKGTSNHYSWSMLLKNEGIYPEHHFEQLSLFDNDNSESERRYNDLVKMLGENFEQVSRIRFLIVDYINYEAVDAVLEDYTSNFQLVKSINVSHLLPKSVNMIETEVVAHDRVDDLVNEPQLVSLKAEIKRDE